ncbi:MAG: NUDIX hydrolase [Actinobacteria bacterium]|nr:NUDIX hydrolase [Actinomycetota bacterium]
MTGGAGWYETVSSETVHEGFSTVKVDEVRMPDGSTAEREYVVHDDAVAVVPVLDDGSVLLLRQYRHPVGRYILEIPAGKMDEEGESPAETGRRELREEVGYAADHLVHLVTFENSAGWSDERTHVFLGRGLREAAPPDGFEAEHEEADMEVVRLPFADALAQVRAGELTDAKTVIGLLLAAPHVDRSPASPGA